MQSSGMDLEKLRSIVRGQYGSRVAERTLQHKGHTCQKNMLFEINLGFGQVTIDTPLEYMRGVSETVPVARVSTALKQAGYFSDKAQEIAKDGNVSLQIGGDFYELPRVFSERTYSFIDDLNYSRALPEEGVLYRFFVIEDDVQNILTDILNIKKVAEQLRHYANNFQADIGCFGPPQQGYLINPPKARI